MLGSNNPVALVAMMKYLTSAPLRSMTLGLACLLAGAATLTQAKESASDSNSNSASGWMFGFAPYNWHFSDAKKEHDWEPDNQDHAYVWLLQAEKSLNERNVAGFAVFNNSFGQFSQYAYYGWRFRPFDSTPGLFFKVTAGVIHGYKYPYNKKIPLNNKNGWGITAIPAVGYDFSKNWGGQINVLGTAGVMFQINYTMQ